MVIKSLWEPVQDLSSTLPDHGETNAANAPTQNSNDNDYASTMDIINLQDLQPTYGQMC